MLKNAAFVVVTMLCAVPALPCSLVLPDADEWTYPFEDARLPQNAEFRVPGAWASTLPMRFDGPGGAVAASMIVDDISAVVLPETPLVPGAWTLTIEPQNPDAETRVVAFELLAEVDDIPPVIAAASATVRTVGDFFTDPDGCGGGRHDELVVSVRLDENEAAAMAMLVDQGAVGVFFGAEADIITGPDVEQVDVVAIDFAGNVSEPVTVTVEAAHGCSSSSMPAAVPLALGLLWRRRRR